MYKRQLAQLRVDTLIVPQLNYYRWTLPVRYGEYDFETYAYAAGEYETAQEAYETVLDKAGTINRDAIEQRIVSDVRNGVTTHNGGSKGNGIIDTENDAEGFIAYSTDYTVPADSDGDGMPDAWETAHGLNPQVADNNMVNSDGYTALEVYLNSLMGEKMDTHFTSGIVAPETDECGVWYADGMLHIGSAAGQPVVVSNSAGQTVLLTRANTESLSLEHLPRGFYIVSLTQATGKRETLKIIR